LPSGSEFVVICSPGICCPGLMMMEKFPVALLEGWYESTTVATKL
jgi:hypothetical protein